MVVNEDIIFKMDFKYVVKIWIGFSWLGIMLIDDLL
jgi:hypothetical protein